MKFLRVGEKGAEQPCILDAEGRARSLVSLVSDITPETTPSLVEKLTGADIDTLPLVDDNARIGAPISQPRNIYCIGLNYSDHAAEAGMDIPEEPIIFTKSSGSYCGPDDDILYSPKMTKLDWEVELGIVIGKPALNISRDEASQHILGFTLVHDVSERAWQLERGGQWSKGKAFPNFCPTGPWIVTPDEVNGGRGLDMWLDVNGRRMQSGNTDTMIFDAETIVSYMSEFTRLEPGDLICTGTPPGVGAGMKPPVWLKIGDRVELGISGLGRQSQRVVAL
ncbi:fumarylacetoacetate hydrolase family protein [Nitratireductor sp. CH_MIT9313-5]|uniref:fumarylacetoacetate hydrolase family protein n=1 Tax=Nitratireductor sp. CH_MIT9313-5 TaxID=3107764 RepID=UPI003008A1C7